MRWRIRKRRRWHPFATGHNFYQWQERTNQKLMEKHG